MAEKKRKIPKKKKAVEAVMSQEPEVVEIEEVAELEPSEEDQAKFLEALVNEEAETKDELNGLGMFFDTPQIKEIVINIASSTPTKDFANSMVKLFEEYPNSVITVKSIGAGSTHTLLKASIEVNKLLLPKGKLLSRFDFWSMSEGKSVNNTRFIMVDILPHSLASALVGHGVEYVSIDEFIKGDKDNER